MISILKCGKSVTRLTAVKGPGHALAFPVGDVELLVGDEELRPHVLARVHLLLGVPALAGERETVLEEKIMACFYFRNG